MSITLARAASMFSIKPINSVVQKIQVQARD